MANRVALAVLVAGLALPAVGEDLRPGRIRGHVVDPCGYPVAGMRVGLVGVPGGRSTETDAGGLYAFDNLAFVDYRINVNAPGFELATKAVHLSPESPEVWASLAVSVGLITDVPTLEIHLVIEDDHGKPVSGARAVVSLAFGQGSDAEEHADEHGRIKVVLNRSGQYLLLINAPGYAPHAEVVGFCGATPAGIQKRSVVLMKLPA